MTEYFFQINSSNENILPNETGRHSIFSSIRRHVSLSNEKPFENHNDNYNEPNSKINETETGTFY